MLDKVTVAITYFNSSQFIRDAIYLPLIDERIQEIVIYNDGSSHSESKKLRQILNSLQKSGLLKVYENREKDYLDKKSKSHHNLIDPVESVIFKGFEVDIGLSFKKIKLVESKVNSGAYIAKYEAVKHANSEWVILLDADNHLIESSLDSLFSIKSLSSSEMYVANIALMNRPGNFPWDFWNFRHFGTNAIDLTRIRELLDHEEFGEEKISHLLNNGNMLINRNKYLDSSKFGFSKANLVSAKDASLFSACWLVLGNSIRVVPSFMYFHRLHSESFWMRNLSTPKLTEMEIIALVSGVPSN